MSRLRKLQGLITQANAEQDARIYVDYLYKERSKKKAERKRSKAARRTNRGKK